MRSFELEPHWIVVGGLALAFFSTLSVLGFWRRQAARAGPRGARELGHSPGRALRDALELAGLDAAEYAALGLVLLPLATVSAAYWWSATDATEVHQAMLLLASVSAALQAWVLWRLWSVLRHAWQLRYGSEAGLAAGQELNTLGGMGYRVFHDVPLGERATRVDHVVVGSAGVFALRTEARAGGVHAAREATYDGASLCFAGQHETAPLERAVALARRVGEWLQAETGEEVDVQAVVILPGWSVRRTAVSGIPVLGASRVRHFFGRLRSRPGISEALVERIAQCLEARCHSTQQRAA